MQAQGHKTPSQSHILEVRYICDNGDFTYAFFICYCLSQQSPFPPSPKLTPLAFIARVFSLPCRKSSVLLPEYRYCFGQVECMFFFNILERENKVQKSTSKSLTLYQADSCTCEIVSWLFTDFSLHIWATALCLLSIDSSPTEPCGNTMLYILCNNRVT